MRVLFPPRARADSDAQFRLRRRRTFERHPADLRQMRFMVFVRVAEDVGEAPVALPQAMGEAMQEAFADRSMIDAGGLWPTAQSTQVRLTGGRVLTRDSPFAEVKEVVGGYATIGGPLTGGGRRGGSAGDRTAPGLLARLGGVGRGPLDHRRGGRTVVSVLGPRWPAPTTGPPAMGRVHSDAGGSRQRLLAPGVGAACRRAHPPTRDVGLAVDLAQDALVAALEQWPVEGVPHRPRAC